MKNAEYWAERAEQVLLEAERNTEKYLVQIDAIYREIADEIDRKIKKIFDTYRAGMPKEDASKWLNRDIPRTKYEALQNDLARVQDERLKKQILMRLNAPAYRYRITRWEYIKQQIAVKLSVAADAEKRISTECYRNTVSQSYLHTMYEIQKGIEIGFSIALLPDKTIDRLLSSKWHGRNFSTSIWQNRGKVANAAAQVLKKGILSGASIQEMSKDLMGRTYTQSMYNATRLIRTEVNYFSGQGALESYKEAEIDQYEFIATLDRRTSQICREHDGRMYRRKDATVGVNYPPMHPYCRSTTAAVIDVPGLERLNKRAARDKNGKSVKIENISYPEWKRRYVDNVNGRGKT
jgi:SPP1 gp7 family putative phage head morphogenesis protein